MLKFQIEFHNEACILILNSEMDRESVIELKPHLLEMTENPQLKLFVVDFKKTPELHEDPLAEIVRAAKTLQDKKVPSYALNVSPQLQPRLRALDPSACLHLKASMEEIEALHVGSVRLTKTYKFDTAVLNPLIKGALEILQTRTKTKCKIGVPFTKGNGPLLPVDLKVDLRIDSSRFSGLMSLCLPDKVFCKLIEGMKGFRPTLVTDENSRLACDWMSLIFEKANGEIKSTADQLQRLEPVSFHGLNLRSQAPLALAPVLVVPIDSHAGGFHLEFALDLAKAEKGH